ncbi:hypothetical protein B0H66DRAFT_616450 [Apodospora peruviana]|uniref:ZW10 C-terminal helical domain-containing protein n=1 Tax=Apodospora peruviana TaxID=516989 RepID=A0AAE0III5_9PEZI|nr:hypothetical protein B0H66DRAFT_616450 [Apodospora peruviana]
MAFALEAMPVGQIAHALVDFSLHGAFPEEKVSSLLVGASALPPAIEALAEAKAKLQAEIHTINKETADDVRSWKTNAQSVQDDILRSKVLANDILNKAEAPAASGKTIADAEAKAAFLVRELNYNSQVQDALRGIKGVNQILDEVEQARDERRILDALHLLEKSWNKLDAIPVSKSCRALKLLDIRAFELKSSVHVVFDRVWKALIHVDVEGRKVSISDTREDEPMSLSDAVIGLKAYKEADERAAQLWHDINNTILIPRMDIAQDTLPTVHIEDSILELRGSTDNSIESLLADLEKILTFLVQKLPHDLVETISSVLLPEIMPKITKVWLDSAVPSSLDEMDRFQKVIAAAKGFFRSLKSLGLFNLGDLHEWADGAPRVWLSKRREVALDSVRSKFSQGLGASKPVERVEKHMVSKSEGKHLASNRAVADDDNPGWDTAWSDGEEEAEKEQADANLKAPPAAADDDADDDGADAWGWDNDDNAGEREKPEECPKQNNPDVDEEDPAAAWGWGDETTEDKMEGEAGGAIIKSAPSAPQPQTRELTIKETYNITSMPQPVLDLIFAIIEDGAALTQDNYANSPVAAAAAGLFSLPTLALAMFRAVSPYYYAPDIAGNMFLYNDATYLSERLAEFAAAWKVRDDISTRAQNMLRLDNDIKSLQNFANRAYSNEMSMQKTIVRDMLGGEQNFMHQDDIESCVSAAVARVRAMAIAWEPILARSAWQQAVGSLANAVAVKIIGDVMELPSIGQDEAYNIANLIATVTALDDLFLPPGSRNEREGEEVVPTTAQYAPSWLRLKYLSEVLQSNLKDVRYLWMESELSLYFLQDEVIDLVKVSFEDNSRTREVVKEIMQNPRPMEQGR